MSTQKLLGSHDLFKCLALCPASDCYNVIGQNYKIFLSIMSGTIIRRNMSSQQRTDFMAIVPTANFPQPDKLRFVDQPRWRSSPLPPWASASGATMCWGTPGRRVTCTEGSVYIGRGNIVKNHSVVKMERRKPVKDLVRVGFLQIEEGE